MSCSLFRMFVWCAIVCPCVQGFAPMIYVIIVRHLIASVVMCRVQFLLGLNDDCTGLHHVFIYCMPSSADEHKHIPRNPCTHLYIKQGGATQCDHQITTTHPTRQLAETKGGYCELVRFPDVSWPRAEPRVPRLVRDPHGAREDNNRLHDRRRDLPPTARTLTV